MKNKSITEKRRKIEIIDLIIFFTIIVIFGIALMGYYPGLLTSDSVGQINQVETENYKNSHPIFHTYIVGNITKIFGTPAAVCVLQIIIFSIIWTWGCKVTRENNNSNLNKVLQFIFTLIVAIIPQNFLYSITLWKDILYSYSMLAAIICIYIGILHNYKYTISQIFIIILSCVCIMKLRHNGVPIGILIFIILLIMNFVKERKIKISGIFIGGFLIVYMLTSIPQWYYIDKKEYETKNQKSAGSVLDSTKVYCMGALLNSDIQLDDEEIEFLNTIMDVEKWKKSYDKLSGNYILFNSEYHSKVLGEKEANEKFNELFMKYAKQKPQIILNHFITVNSIWWSPKVLGYTNTVITNNGSISEMSNGKYDNKPVFDILNVVLNKYVMKTLNNQTIYTILYRPVLPLAISVILIAILVFKKKKIGYIFLVMPLILNIGTYIFIMSSQDARYFYPTYITCYFIILICIEKFSRIKNCDKCIKENKKGDKTLIIIPAYNEGEAIKNTVEKVYEKNSDCDVIVINDGSKDNTLEEAIKTRATVLDLPNNLGIGGAVQSGYLYAYKNNYDIAIQIDGDGQHNPEYVSEMRKMISDKGYNMVIGSRFIEKTSYDQTFFRMLGINITSMIIKIMTDKKIYDTTSGFRAVDRNIIKCFAENYPYDYPEPVTTMKMILNGNRIKEIPVEMNQRTTGVSSISPLKSVKYMIKVTLSLILTGIQNR